MEYQTERPARGFVHEVECDEKDCCTPLKVFCTKELRNESRRDRKGRFHFSTWEWDELHGPSRHLIARPQKERSDSA